MSAHSVHSDDSAVSRADRWLFRIEGWMALAGGVAILGAMILSVVNILGRKFLNWPVPGYVAIMSQIMPVMAFMGIAYCQRLGSHIRMDIVVGTLKGRVLWIAELAGIALMAVLTIALVYGSFDHAIRAFTLGDTTDDMNIPTWPVKMLVPVMFCFLLARFALQSWAYWLAIRSGEDEPVAVPLIEDAATQAMNEAETVSGQADDEVTK
ncbi:TRAP transporter small permease subunit [Salaquimonas pukyongi]|uniref:TRAP transporter small permease subunit n=1 Tax=Salaquimonas pukyongi TaxID=2712698 RepID=UPI00096B70D2|nr:TRAP transporter small permease [Salaquimonas pukyongi]